MSSHGLATILGLVLAVPAPPAAADDRPPPHGPRVRVTSAAVLTGPIVGTLAALDDGSLTVRASGDRGDVRLARESITRIEVSRRRGNRGKAIGLGVLVGIGVAAAVGAATGDDCHGGDWLCFSRADTAAMLAIAGAPAGALVGLAFSHGEKWETTSPDRLRVAIAPTRGGAALRVSFGF